MEPSSSEGLQCILKPSAAEFDIVLVPGLLGDNRRSWTTYDNIFWPRDYLGRDYPDARIWSFNWSSTFKYSISLHSAASNFIVEWIDQRERDQKQNPWMFHFRSPRLVFIADHFGGAIVKKILLDSRSSTSEIRQSIWKSCTGIIFNNVPQLPRQEQLRKSLKWTSLYIKPLKTVATVNLDILAIVKEMETINQEFLRAFSEIPPTLCIVNNVSKSTLSKITPDKANATFESRSDSNLFVNTNRRSLRFSSNEDLSYRTIIARIRPWKDAPLNSIQRSPRPHPMEQIRGARLLSIDGGGVRGLCSLLILDKIMQEVKKLEVALNPESRDWPRLPCRYFDLAGGTSTGGLIAIMLFRLRMDTSRAIFEYRRLSPEIFKSGLLSRLGGNVAKAVIGKPWYEGEALENAVKRIVQERLPEEERLLPEIDIPNATLIPQASESQASEYKMFVCALRTTDDTTVRFRSYKTPDESESEFGNCAIWEAARATSAAPFFFPTAKVNGQKFWDGGLENNNPIDEVWAEKGNIQPACVVSLGTGISQRTRSKSTIPALGKGKKILNNLTKVEGRHRNFKERMKNEEIPYFRFNPDIANDVIGLAEHKKLDVLEQHTIRYIEQEDVMAEIKSCAKIIARINET